MKIQAHQIIRYLTCIIVLSTLNINTAFSNEKIKLTTTILPPYQYWDKQHKLIGTAVKPLKCALEKMNQPYELKVYPWKRAQFQVKIGHADGFFIASKNAKRDKYATASAPILQNQWLWYSLKDKQLDIKATSINTSERVGSVMGTNMMTWLNGNFERAFAPENMTNLFTMLNKKRIDLALANNDMFLSSIPREQQDKYTSYFAKERPLRAYFSKTYIKNHPTFLKDFNSAIQSCTKN